MKQINVRLDEEFLKEVRKVCIDKEISFQEAVKIALTEWLEKNKG